MGEAVKEEEWRADGVLMDGGQQEAINAVDEQPDKLMSSNVTLKGRRPSVRR